MPLGFDEPTVLPVFESLDVLQYFYLLLLRISVVSVYRLQLRNNSANNLIIERAFTLKNVYLKTIPYTTVFRYKS